MEQNINFDRIDHLENFFIGKSMGVERGSK